MLFQTLAVQDRGKGLSVFERYKIVTLDIESFAALNCDGTIGVVFSDQSEKLGQEFTDWVEQGNGVRLDLQYRGLQLIWKGDRLFFRGPESLHGSMLEAANKFAVLRRAVVESENFADKLASTIDPLLELDELYKSTAIIRSHFAESSRAHLSAVALRSPIEHPQASGKASPAMRICAELVSQAMLSDRLDLAIHRLEVIEQQFNAMLDRTLEFKRGRAEAVIGVIIVLILIADFANNIGIIRFR